MLKLSSGSGQSLAAKIILMHLLILSYLAEQIMLVIFYEWVICLHHYFMHPILIKILKNKCGNIFSRPLGRQKFPLAQKGGLHSFVDALERSDIQPASYYLYP